MTDGPSKTPNTAKIPSPPRVASVDVDAALPNHAALPLTPEGIYRLQRTVGNRAAQRLVQRDPAPQDDSAVAVAQRQPTPIQMPLFKAGDYVSGVVEGQIEYLNPSADPDAPSPVISAGEFGQTFKAKSLEFSASLMKMPSPLDDTMNQWLGLGESVKVSTSLAMFKLATDMNYKDLKDVDVGLNVGEIELALSGKFDHTTMQSEWGQKLFGGTAIGRALAKKQAVFSGTIKLSLALPAEDALRLAQVARYHKQLRAIAYQNKVWMQTVRGLKLKMKDLELAWKTTKDAFQRMNIAKQLGETRASLKAYGKAIAKNKKLGKKLLADAAAVAAKFLPALKATLGRFIPILNAYFLITDAVKAVEVIYGILSGKGYSFSLGGEEGGDGTGEGLDGGSAPEGAGIDGESASAEDAEFAGIENQAAGGGDEFAKPAELNANALEVYNLLLKHLNGEPSPADIDLLNAVVSSDLNAEHMERLLASLQTGKLSGNPMKAMTQVLAFVRQARAAVDNAPSADGAKPGQGTGDQAGSAAGEDEIILLDEDETYAQTQAQSASTEKLDPNANEIAPDSPNPVPVDGNRAPAPPDIDPEVKAFMLRALVALESGQSGYAEMDNAASYNNLSAGDVFRGMVAVQVPTTSRDAEGVVTQSKVWYGGEAQFKVLQKLGDGQLMVIRSVMQAYNRYGRFVGTVGAATMTVGFKGALTPSK